MNDTIQELDYYQNNTYQCLYNFSNIESINCTQLLLDIENKICNNITNIDKCIFQNDIQDNNSHNYNNNEEKEGQDYISLILILSIFFTPLICCIFCYTKNDIYRFFANIFKSIWDKLKKCFYFLRCNREKEIDLELGIPGYSYNIKGCKMINCNDETNINQECTICLADLYSNKNEKNILSLGCNHRYHFECIDPWFRNQIDNYHTPNCPLCRKEINILKNVVKVSYQVNYDSDGSDFSFSDY